MLKVVAGMGAVLGALAYFAQDEGYARTVAAPPEAVAAALSDLDVTDAPGSPGSDPMRSGGLPSDFVLTREGSDLVWTVTNGGQVAVRLIAHLEPAPGGKTRVTLDYERGEAPDDHVAPAFRSRGISLGLFAMVMEDELDRLTTPPGEWTEKCDAIMERFEAEGISQFDGAPPPDDLKTAIGHTAKTAMRLAALEKELKLKGCPTGFRDDFRPISNEMGEAPVPQPGVSYQPAAPMIDVRR